MYCYDDIFVLFFTFAVVFYCHVWIYCVRHIFVAKMQTQIVSPCGHLSHTMASAMPQLDGATTRWRYSSVYYVLSLWVGWMHGLAWDCGCSAWARCSALPPKRFLRSGDWAWWRKAGMTFRACLVLWTTPPRVYTSGRCMLEGQSLLTLAVPPS